VTVSRAIRRAVRDRAENHCEYCRLAQSEFSLVTFHVEQVIAKQHGGGDDIANLCLACHWCNLFNGPNLSSLADGELTRLFNPRTDDWCEHFQLVNGVISGNSPVGAATASLLNMNDADRVELRRLG